MCLGENDDIYTLVTMSCQIFLFSCMTTQMTKCEWGISEKWKKNNSLAICIPSYLVICLTPCHCKVFDQAMLKSDNLKYSWVNRSWSWLFCCIISLYISCQDTWAWCYLLLSWYSVILRNESAESSLKLLITFIFHSSSHRKRSAKPDAVIESLLQ